jgi:hypothetical protein
VSTSGGTNDTSSPNMVQTAAYVYDGGAVGDGDLTQMTTYPTGLTDTAHWRVTNTYYDWRDRPVATKEGALATVSSEDTTTHRPITVLAYDNLGAVTLRQRYDGDRVAVAVTADGSGVTLTLPGGSTDPSPRLRAQSATAYDDQGRVYLTRTSSVDPNTGAVAKPGLLPKSWSG